MNQAVKTVQAPLTDAAIWLRNLETLYKTDSRFAHELDDLPPNDQLQIESARNGSPTLKVRLPDGKEIYLHSKYDPENEAKKFVDSLDLDKNFVFVFSGVGLGYQIRELFDRASSQTIVVVFEPEVSVIRLALWTHDFVEEIQKGRLIFLHRVDKGLMHTRLLNVASTTILGTSFEALTYTRQWHADFHSEMRTFFTDFMAYCRMGFVTMLGNSKITQQNVANNLAAYMCHPPIDILKRRFEGYPAIIVSAGPSLAKNVHLLKQAKGRAVIIAVQTTLKPLLSMGIEPDFVTSLDWSEASKRFFEGLKDFGQILLVAEPKANWTVIDAFKGSKTLLSNEFADQCLGPAKKQRDGLRAGSTVAHLSLYLAEYMAANPIIMIGQDLGFSDNLYYAPGNAVHDMWSVELNRFYSLEMKEWERIVRNRDILRKVSDINGRTIFTDEQMFTYLQQFERDFAQSPCTIIDATEGGVSKRGTTIMPLAQALERYAGKNIPEEKFDFRKNITQFDPSALPELSHQLENRLHEVEDFKALCEKTTGLLKQLQGLIDKPDEFNKLIIEVDEIRSLVNAHLRTLQMVCAVSSTAELRRFMHDCHLEAESSTGQERAVHQLSRDIEYLDSLARGCDELTEILQTALDRVKHTMEESVKQS